MSADLRQTELPADSVGLLEGLATTRAIRRYVDEPIPESVLRNILWAATRAPSGSNRQPFRFVVLHQSEVAKQAKALIATSAQRFWAEKRILVLRGRVQHHGYTFCPVASGCPD